MASDASIFVRIDSQTKMEAEAILRQLGVTPSSLINMLYHKVILTGGIPFSVNLHNREPLAVGGLSEEEIMKIVQKGVDDVKEGRTYPAEVAEEMFNELTGRKR